MHSLAQPSAQREGGWEQRDTEIQEMPEREAAATAARAHQLTHGHIRPHIDHPHMIYPSPVIALLFREAVVIYEILK